jgi:radical SAM superfamily enzyme YgiQ (UPF0313 family)
MACERRAEVPNETSVWLADLTHYSRGPASETMPIGIGFIASYVAEECGLREPVRLFKYPAALAKAIERGALPSVMGFSNYIWNSMLSLGFAQVIRRRSPSTTVVMGGPHFPKEPYLAEAFLRAHPEIDFYVEGEGEKAFAELVRLIGAGGRWRAEVADRVPSLRWMASDGRFCATPMADRLRELDLIPSPYLTGKLDEFFDGELVPALQTNRGCPFTCTFCTEGGAYYSKLGSFSETRVVAELEYIGERMQRVIQQGGRDDLLITDSNFAMYKPDRTTCAQIKRCRDDYGWPARVNVTTGKNRRERVLESVSLADGAIQLSGAVQSLEQTVLENINRHNIDTNALIAIAQQSAEHGTPTYSDVILGLPGDTRAAHVTTVSTLVNAGFGRINTFQCALLPGTELYADATREKFGIQTKFRTVPRGCGRYPVGADEVLAVEVDEVTVETSTMTFEDYLWCRVFDLALFVLYNDQVMAATVAVARRLGIDLGQCLIRAVDADWPGRLSRIREEYVMATEQQLFGTRDECEAFALANISRYVDADLGRNLLYTYRAIAISDALEDIGRLAVALLTEDAAATDRDDILAEAVRFDVLSLWGVLDPGKDSVRVRGRFAFDIPSLMASTHRHDDSIEQLRKSVDVVFEMSEASRTTRNAYARAMGRDVSGMGRALTRVPIGELKRVATTEMARPRAA